MMVANLQSQPARPVDTIMMLTMLTSLVLLCHTWLLHHDGGRPPKSVSEASGPHHDAYHVDIIGFDVSHLVIDQLSTLPSRYFMMSFTMYMAAIGIIPDR